MDTRELIQSIIASEEDAGDKFLESMEERISDALEVRKVELASGLMGEALKPEFEYDPNDPNASGNEMKTIQKHTYKVPKGLKPQFASPESRYKMLRKAAKKMKEEVEQIDELKAGKYAAVALQRSGYHDIDDLFDGPGEQRGDDKKHADVVRRATKKFGPKVGNQLANMDQVRDQRVDARIRSKNDYLANPYPKYDGNKTTKSGKLNKVAGRILKKQIKSRLANEEVEQIDELKKSTLASYAGKAAKNIRTSTNLARGFEDQKYAHMKVANMNHPNVYTGRKKDPAKLADAEKGMKAAGDLENEFKLKAQNRIRGITRATERLAREEVEQVNEVEIGGGITGLPDSQKIGTEIGKALGKMDDFLKLKKADKLKFQTLKHSKKVPEPLDYVTVTSKKIGLPEQQMAPLPNGGVADTEFSKSVANANKATASKMQQRLDAMKKKDAENEMNRPPVRQEETQLSDAQKLALMKTKNSGMVRTAMNRYRKVKDINKLSPAHRTIVSGYLEKTGGIDDLPRSVAAKLLKPKKQ